MQLLNSESFKGEHQGKETALYTLKNDKGMVVQITNFGAKIASLFVPDRNGSYRDVVLGYGSIGEYISGNPYFGAVCGRYANRIARGQFSISDQAYQLAVNNGPNALHGGLSGFNDKVWDVVAYDEATLHLSYLSADGEEGYPGLLKVDLIYVLTAENELELNYTARCDRDTILNLTSHSFFNLAGEGSGSILQQELMINADHYTPCDEVQISTGEIASVASSPFDFRESKPMGRDIEQDNAQLAIGKGYDHNFVLNHFDGKVRLAAVAYDPQSGVGMEIHTNTPGMQLYTANWLDGSDVGKGHAYGEREAFCLECQWFPDSPNKPQFPSTHLAEGEVYEQKTIHRFFVKSS